jgi:hypothetical protein
MLKGILIETLLTGHCDLAVIANRSGILLPDLKNILSSDHPAEPTTEQFASIIKSIPAASIIAGVSAEMQADIDYLDCQIVLLEQSFDDHYQPMFSGMRRLLRRIVSG